MNKQKQTHTIHLQRNAIARPTNNNSYNNIDINRNDNYNDKKK